MLKFIRNIGRSILFKLLLVFVLTAVVLVLVVGGIVRHYTDESPHRELIGRNLAQYSTYLIDEIGAPPDLQTAERLAAELGFAIAINTPTVEWSSELRRPDHPQIRYQTVSGFPEVEKARYRGRLFIRVNEPSAEFLLVFGRRGGWGSHNHGEVLLLLLLAIGAVLTVSYLIVRWLLQPLRWLTGGMERMGGGCLDTTIPIRKHDELGDLTRVFNNMSARIRNSVRAKQQLLLDVSHELRSPMTRMKLAAEFIAEKKVRKQILADLREMEVMTTEILESERLTSEQGGLARETVDLTSLIKEVSTIYDDRPPGIKLVTHEFVCAFVDPERARVVVRNVIENALKYSAGQTRPVEVAVNAAPDGVSITIEDFGEGIPARDLELLFEPFYRVDKSRQKRTGGYGLGLSLCKKIMDAHAGSIAVESEVGKGTKFTIVFPNQAP